MNYTDQELIERYLKGDKRAFDFLVLRYLKIVYSVVFHYSKNKEDAEDLTQEAFVKAMKHLGSFDAERPFKPWICQIARHQALDWLKKKRPVAFSELESNHEASLLETIADPAPLADVLASNKEQAAMVTDAIKELSHADQRLLLYRYLKGLTFQEMAQELGELLNTVKSRHRRILLKLRKTLEKSATLS